MLDSKMIEGAINAAGFTEEELTTAMKVMKLLAQLGLKRAERTNLESKLSAQTAEYSSKVNSMLQEEADITAAINELAPVS